MCFFFKQKTAYEMRISDWSSDVCSSDLSLFLDPILWWVLRAMTGFCFAALYMIIESWLNEKSTNETRGFVFSLYTIINLTVLTIGQLMLTLARPADFPLFMLASKLGRASFRDRVFSYV